MLVFENIIKVGSNKSSKKKVIEMKSKIVLVEMTKLKF